MSNFHGHGAFGAQLLGSRNLTPHSSSMNVSSAIDPAEDTGLSPIGGAKTFLYGLNGHSASSNGYAVNDFDFLDKELAQLTSSLLSNELLTQAYFNLTSGNHVVFLQSKRTSYSLPNSLSSAATTAINATCDSVRRDGWSLLNPFGSGSVSQNEIQELIFENADVNQFFGLRAIGTSEVFAFQAGATNSAIKAGIEALAAYSARTVTITGSRTGTATKTGTLMLSFDGAVGVPALEVISGQIENFVVENGSSGNYTVDGGANFALGVSEGTLQTNIRAVGGQRSAVVVKGSSLAAVQTIRVDGASIPEWNTDYLLDGTINSKPAYTSEDTRHLNYDGTRWVIKSDADNTYYQSPTNDGSSVPTSGWQTVGFGAGTPPSSVTTLNATGSADFLIFYPVTATPSAPSATGTGASITRTATYGDPAETISGSTIAQGGSTAAIYNLLTATANGTAHDGGATTTTGFYARLQVLLAAGSALVVLVEHSDSPSSGYTTLNTFTSVTNPADEALLVQEFVGAANATVKRYVRARITTITGTFAAFVGYARKP